MLGFERGVRLLRVAWQEVVRSSRSCDAIDEIMIHFTGLSDAHQLYIYIALDDG